MTFKTKKIAIFTSSLGVGGAEKFAANLTFIIQGLSYEVHVISVLDKIDFIWIVGPTLDVDTSIGGFQFSVDGGATVTGGAGGDAAGAGFVVQGAGQTRGGIPAYIKNTFSKYGICRIICC